MMTKTRGARRQGAPMPEEQLILVDEGNRATGAAGKTAIHRSGLLHRAFSILILRISCPLPR
jgi:isopentenyldiphosphate isomerase